MISGLAPQIRALELTAASALPLPSVAGSHSLNLLTDLGEDWAARVAYRDGGLDMRPFCRAKGDPC